MPNPWDEVDKTLNKAIVQRKKSQKIWLHDRCPVCFKSTSAVQFRADHGTVRLCGDGHMWIRTMDGGYVVLEGQPRTFEHNYCITYPGLRFEPVSAETPAGYQ